ncbi:MAG TPA: mercury(II) reductase [Proteobacteria bacterium]|nr:mercuric reductase [bacterium BMS3Abin14]HDL52451.1 mercury(II) reductase [Pseudomonadota bacterium]
MGKYDLVIIGGGAGGFGAAIKANDIGARTAMINVGLPLGGTCVNVGCVPSKALLYAGEVLHAADHHGVPGIGLTRDQFDFPTVVQAELDMVEKLRGEKYEHVLKGLENITLFEGKGRFVSSNQVEVNGKTIEGKKLLVATGSTARVPAIEGIEDTGFLTHIEALKLKRTPKDMIVIGAGAVGLEFSQMYSRFGTHVTLLRRSGSIYKGTEPELAVRLRELLEGEGISIALGVEYRKAWVKNGRKHLSYISGGKEVVVSGDEILLAAGKDPNTNGLALDIAGVKTNGKGAIAVNGFMQTSQPHIFAAGDVVDLPRRLETTAGREGTLGAQNALSGSKDGVDYDAVPYTVFTDPQLSGVGLTEEELMKREGICSCRTVSFERIPKAIITGRTEGLVRMVINPKTRRIHGIHFLSNQSSELAAIGMMLIRNQNTIDDVIESMPVFPSMAESIKLAAISFTRDISAISCCV